jgi:hypothetical protein
MRATSISTTAPLSSSNESQHDRDEEKHEQNFQCDVQKYSANFKNDAEQANRH